MIDKAAIRAKYAEERGKRIRADGNDQYRELDGMFAHYKADPYNPVTPRAPVNDHVTFAFIGGGFAGLVTGARLVEAGVKDIRIVEKGGDFGGTWYWNRYPGAQCDTASMIYMPLLEETGHMPSEKYAHAPEILAHSKRIAAQFGLYDKALLHTEVTDLIWDENARHWIVHTNRGDAFTAQFVGLGTGPLHVPKLPGIPGIERFRGHSFHTSRWDYGYTGGTPEGAPMERLADKRVAIIGTGATAVQAVPHLARDAGTLYVCQRTPSSVDARDNGPIDPDWFASVAGPGWQDNWFRNFAAHFSGFGIPEEDLVGDGWTDLAKRMRARMADAPVAELTPAKALDLFEDADHEKMSEIRARTDAIVKDKATADGLKAWYRQLCKRPCFHDDFLQSFNNPNTHLIDTGGKGVETITEKGVVVAGREYEVDCIVYASGFEVGTSYKRRSGFDVTGEGGITLSHYWEQGMRSLHGIHVHGFPNMFIVHPAQGANLISNVPHNLVESGRTIARIVSHTLEAGKATVSLNREAEDQWLALLATGPGMIIGTTECTPGYYNNEGQGWEGTPGALGMGYPYGAIAYFNYLDTWRNSGAFEGLTFA
jgi:cation diffusion facilitator CzcD-associated flavoprotein CzcO